MLECPYASSRWEIQPIVTSRSCGPSPSAWYARLTSPLCAYCVRGRSPVGVAGERAGVALGTRGRAEAGRSVSPLTAVAASPPSPWRMAVARNA